MAKRKIKIPKSVLDLNLSPKKYAKKNGIKLKGKGVSKKTRKRNLKRLKEEYAEAIIRGIDKAVKILSENPLRGKKMEKVQDGVENAILYSDFFMKKLIKIYNKDSESYPNMIYFPSFIMKMIEYSKSADVDEKDREYLNNLDIESLIEFCEKILKTQIKRYRKMGMSQEIAMMLAVSIPTTKPMRNGNRHWYNRLIRTMYQIAETNDISPNDVLKAVRNIDKKPYVKKADFYRGFFSEFILQRQSNKNAKFTDTQKDLHEDILANTLMYLNDMKPRQLRELLKSYIKIRKTAENNKNDSKRIFKFIDYANSNSSYTNIKSVVQDLISDNAAVEIYLS